VGVRVGDGVDGARADRVYFPPAINDRNPSFNPDHQLPEVGSGTGVGDIVAVAVAAAALRLAENRCSAIAASPR